MRELKRTTLLDSTIQALHQAFFNGEIKPGEHLSEPHFSKRLGVSRSTVREALRHLEQEGWVTRIPYKGTFVRVMNEEDLKELNSLRATLETFAAELAIECATDDEIASLSDIIEQMESAASSGRIRQAMQLHFAFHERLCVLSGHSLLHRHWSILASQTGRMLHPSPEVLGFLEDGKRLVQEHRPIVDALAARDVERSREVIRHHIILA